MRCGKMVTGGLTSRKKWGVSVLGLGLAMVLWAVQVSAAGRDPRDPYEALNRRIFAFNMMMDRKLLRPITILYNRALPMPVRTGIRNFYFNLGTLGVIANEILQLHAYQAVANTFRFLVNSTLGLAGTIDVASKLGIPKHKEDFGRTIGVWGGKKTPYLVLPFLGPSTMQDVVGSSVDYLCFSVWPHIESDTLFYSLKGVDLLQNRAALVEGDALVYQAFDPYLMVKDAYLQRREFLVEESKES